MENSGGCGCFGCSSFRVIFPLSILSRLAAFFPPCPFHELLNWYCPGCGSTRATYGISRGNLSLRRFSGGFLT
ncbi:MAG: DUF2752 domain-containing protein [Lentisphaeria bacterium]|nr:DUF2752 domain-containing protein [Lentisphaeria bacterium]